jgi:hypothetical protein
VGGVAVVAVVAGGVGVESVVEFAAVKLVDVGMLDTVDTVGTHTAADEDDSAAVVVEDGAEDDFEGDAAAAAAAVEDGGGVVEVLT